MPTLEYLADIDRLTIINDSHRYHIKSLQKEIQEKDEAITRYKEALESIGNNSCCKPCREAGLVARTALKEVDGESDE